jgi:hypothetical protein
MTPSEPPRPLSTLAAMARRRRISLLWCVLALAIAGCGSGDDGTIPPEEADNLLTLLSDLEDDVAAGDCDLAQQHAQEVATAVEELPGDVDPEVADALAGAADNLDRLAQEPGECTETGTSGAAEEQPATEPTEAVTPTTTTEETTTTTTDEETSTPEPEEEEPSEEPEAPAPTEEGPSGGPTEDGAESPSGGITGGGDAGKR